MSEISFMRRKFSFFFVLCRCFFLSKIEEKLTLPDDHSMDIDGDADSSDRMEGREQEEDICSLVKSCKFSMKMKMIESARKQVGTQIYVPQLQAPPGPWSGCTHEANN